MNIESSSKKVVLRKKAPFFCRAQNIEGTFVCLVPLAETEGNFCASCVEKQKAVAVKANAPIPRDIETQRETQAEKDAAWQARLAKGPIWPTDESSKRCGHLRHEDECPTCREAQQSNAVEISGQEAK